MTRRRRRPMSRHAASYCFVYTVAGALVLAFIVTVGIALFDILAPALMCVVHHHPQRKCG